MNCLYSCKTCSTATTCVSCNITALRIINTYNQCICAAKYYDDGINQLCLACSYACLTCSNTSTNCTTCDSVLRLLINGWCSCFQYFYDNNLTIACSSCQYTCSTCTTVNSCTSCNSSKFRIFDSQNQYCQPITGYYDDGIN